MFGGVNPYGFLPGVTQNQAAAIDAVGRAGTAAPAGNGVPAGSAAQQSGSPGPIPNLAPRPPSGGSQGFQPVQQPQVGLALQP